MLTIKWKKGYRVELKDGVIVSITKEMNEKKKRFCRDDVVRLVSDMFVPYGQFDRIKLVAGTIGFIVGICDPDETRIEDVLSVQLFKTIEDGRRYPMKFIDVERLLCLEAPASNERRSHAG